MNNEDKKNLALELLHADTEDKVIEILSEAELWDDPQAWRYYGDREGNYATIGNQQSRPEAALVEKVVNAVDARLMNECLVHGIDPSSARAPQSVQEAVRKFFEERDPSSSLGGTVASWSQQHRLKEAQNITLAVTGSRRNPSITIVDRGEGQTPKRMPETFLSIDRSNKLRIPFVQGKFNMGGTGALNFCGKQSLQLIVTRRNPLIAEQDGDPTAECWGITVVRRDWPRVGAGEARNSVFTYLAPIGAESAPNKGEVLTFSADELPLMPENNSAYVRAMDGGSVVKLYEYQMKGTSHVLRKGLLSRLELLLPDIALPVRVHECRDYEGKEEGSFANTLVGLTARLSENRGGNLEDGFPTPILLRIQGEEMRAQIYAFKEDKAESYRANEGIVFVVNGQTHGHLPKTFFSRKKVKMGRLAKSLIIVVDCTQLSLSAREKLFMNSRDRLREGELRRAIEEELEEQVGKHPALRELRERRQSEEVAERLEDSRPLEEVLESVLKSSPALEKLFLLGQRLNKPRRTNSDGHHSGESGANGHGEFVGRPHPTFFRFHKKPESDLLDRTCEVGRRSRIKFETDVSNDYFSRKSNPGEYIVEVIEGDLEDAEIGSSLTLHNGIASWSVSFPSELLTIGDKITLQFTVTDPTLVEPFVKIVRLDMVPRCNSGPGFGDRESSTGGGRKGPRGNQDNVNGGGRGPREPGGLRMPEVHKVREEQWDKYGFDQYSACKIFEDAVDEQNEDSVYTFYVNVDNLYLRNDMKGSKEDPALVEGKFVYGNVLVGLALLHHDRQGGAKQEEADRNGEETVAGTVEQTTRALGPFLVPMINYLGALSVDEVAGLAETGDDE